MWVSVFVKKPRLEFSRGVGPGGWVSYRIIRYGTFWGFGASWGVGRVRVCAVLGREGGSLLAGVAFGGTRTSAGAVS